MMAIDLLDLALLILILLGVVDIKRHLGTLEKVILDGQTKEEKKLLRSDERRVRKLDGRLHH